MLMRISERILYYNIDFWRDARFKWKKKQIKNAIFVPEYVGVRQLVHELDFFQHVGPIRVFDVHFQHHDSPGGTVNDPVQFREKPLADAFADDNVVQVGQRTHGVLECATRVAAQPAPFIASEVVGLFSHGQSENRNDPENISTRFYRRKWYAFEKNYEAFWRVVYELL